MGFASFFAINECDLINVWSVLEWQILCSWYSRLSMEQRLTSRV